MPSEVNQTIAYYNKMEKESAHWNYKKEREKTYSCFTAYLRKGAHIIDLGCGFGYDAKYFIDKGYMVTPVDGSITRCKAAQKYLGIPVVEASFESYQPDTFFDAVWSMDALVHIEREQLVPTINRITRTMKPHGIFFFSVPYGDFEGYKDGCFYSYLNEDWLEDADMHLNGLKVAECHIEELYDEEGEMRVWMSVLMVKKE